MSAQKIEGPDACGIRPFRNFSSALDTRQGFTCQPTRGLPAYGG
jgi:hypothetical protein